MTHAQIVGAGSGVLIVLILLFALAMLWLAWGNARRH